MYANTDVVGHVVIFQHGHIYGQTADGPQAGLEIKAGHRSKVG